MTSTTGCPLRSRLWRGRFASVVLATVLAVFAAACSSGETASSQETSVSAAPTTTTATTESSTTTLAESPSIETPPGLDRLTPGPHLGVSWFSPPSSGHEAEAVALHQASFEAGSDIDRVLLDWTEVERAAGVYDLADLEEELVGMTEAGVQPMVTISFVGDPEQDFIPSYLGGWDTEEAAAAYLAMLEAAIPLMTQHQVWALSIANEPEVAIDDDLLTAAEFRRFTELVVSGARTLDPELPITATLGADSVFRGAGYVRELLDELDVAVFNHYCLHGDLTVVDADEIDGRFDTLIDIADGKPIVFQELGCPASEAIGSSTEFQAQWFATAFDRVLSEPQIRAAYVFELLDWSPDLVDLLYGHFVDGSPLGERLSQWLLTTGLLTYEDSSPRPAWDVFIEAVVAT